MRISLYSEVIRELPEQQCAFARAVDYDGLEIAPFMWSDEPHLLSPLRRAQVPRQGRHRRWETPCRDAPQWRGEVARSLAQPTCVAPRRVLDWDPAPPVEAVPRDAHVRFGGECSNHVKATVLGQSRIS